MLLPSEMPTDRYLTEHEVSRITGFSLSKLRQDRFKRRGLPYLKVGKNVRYRHVDVKEYMERCLVKPEACVGP